MKGAALVPRSFDRARLPEMYSGARSALAECERIDECREWANKAEALASYARQAKDEELLVLAGRIKARAMRRAGELLQQIEPRAGATEPGTDRGRRRAAAAPTSRGEAASAAGLSVRQRKDALRIANVPEPAFTAAVESPRPPTIKALSDMGKGPAPVFDLKGRDPKDFKAATRAQAAIDDLAKVIETTAPDVVARGSMDKELPGLRTQVAACRAWLRALAKEIG